MVRKTGSKSPGEPLITCSTSAVAVCCWSGLVQGPICFGARDGDHRLLGEGLQQLDLSIGETAALAVAKGESPNCRVAAH